MRTPSSALPAWPQGAVEGGGNSGHPPLYGAVTFGSAFICAGRFVIGLTVFTILFAIFLGFAAATLRFAIAVLLSRLILGTRVRLRCTRPDIVLCYLYMVRFLVPGALTTLFKVDYALALVLAVRRATIAISLPSIFFEARFVG
jgi:hypothetical protein